MLFQLLQKKPAIPLFAKTKTKFFRCVDLVLNGSKLIVSADGTWHLAGSHDTRRRQLFSVQCCAVYHAKLEEDSEASKVLQNKKCYLNKHLPFNLVLLSCSVGWSILGKHFKFD